MLLQEAQLRMYMLGLRGKTFDAGWIGARVKQPVLTLEVLHVQTRASSPDFCRSWVESISLTKLFSSEAILIL